MRRRRPAPGRRWSRTAWARFRSGAARARTRGPGASGPRAQDAGGARRAGARCVPVEAAPPMGHSERRSSAKTSPVATRRRGEPGPRSPRRPLAGAVQCARRCRSPRHGPTPAAKNGTSAPMRASVARSSRGGLVGRCQFHRPAEPPGCRRIGGSAAESGHRRHPLPPSRPRTQPGRPRRHPPMLTNCRGQRSQRRYEIHGNDDRDRRRSRFRGARA